MIFCTTSYKLPFTAQQFASAEFYDEPYFEDLISLLFPENYLDSLKRPGPGFEVFQGYSLMGERMSLAATRCYLGALILSAAGANFSTGLVQFSRPNDNESLVANAGLTYSPLTGTVTIVNGSADVVGAGTFFTTDAPAGTILEFAGGSRPYRVLFVTDDTHLTLTQVVVDPSAGGIVYSIGWTFGVQQPGTVQITNSSPNIVGTNTTFTQQVSVGDLIEFTGGTQPYHVLSITDDLNLVLTTNVIEANAGGLNWFTGNGESLISVNAGTVVTTSYGGRDYTTDQAITFGIGQLSKIVGVTAVAASYQYNVPGPIPIANGTVLPGSITTIKVPVYTPPYVQTPFSVAQVTDVCGGNPPTLDQLGQDRGINRKNGESDANYRARIRALPDTVSPGAVKRYLFQVQTPLGVTFDYIETWEITYQTCWNAPSPNAGTPSFQPIPPTNPDFDSNLFVYDTGTVQTGTLQVVNGSRTVVGTGTTFLSQVEVGTVIKFSAATQYVVSQVVDDTHLIVQYAVSDASAAGLSWYTIDGPNMVLYPPFRNRWLGSRDYRAAFIVTVPELASMTMLGMAYNDTAVTPADLTDSIGKRAVSAWNVPANNFPGELQGAYNGTDAAKQGVYNSLAEQLDQIKAAGVNVEIVIQGT